MFLLSFSFPLPPSLPPSLKVRLNKWKADPWVRINKHKSRKGRFFIWRRGAGGVPSSRVPRALCLTERWDHLSEVTGSDSPRCESQPAHSSAWPAPQVRAGRTEGSTDSGSQGPSVTDAASVLGCVHSPPRSQGLACGRLKQVSAQGAWGTPWERSVLSTIPHLQSEVAAMATMKLTTQQHLPALHYRFKTSSRESEVTLGRNGCEGT